MTREPLDHRGDALQRQRALLRWENEGGAMQSDQVDLRESVARAVAETPGAPEIEVDATLIGEGLELEPSLVQGYLRQGTISSLCERGIDEDDGHYRLTFYFKKRRFRIVTDRAGNVIEDESRSDWR